MLTKLMQLMFDGDAGGGSGDPPPPADPPKDPPPDATQSEVEKAYAKLREAEKERDQVKAKLTRMEREGLSEVDQLKSENEDLKAEVAGLTMKLDEHDHDAVIDKVADALKFRNKAVARALAKEAVGAEDRGDEGKVRKALETSAKEDPTLVGEKPPPPSGGPIEPGGNSGEGGSAGFTQDIRQAAGRAA